MPIINKLVKASSRIKTVFTREPANHLVGSPAGRLPGSDKSSASHSDDAPPPHVHLLLSHSTAISVTSRSSMLIAQDPILATQNSQSSSGMAIPVADVNGDGLFPDEGDESGLSQQGFAVFKFGLKLAKEVAEPFPPAKAAIGALLNTMEGIENVKGVQEEFAYAGRKVQAIRIIYDEHRSQLEASESTTAHMQSLAQAMRIVEKMVRAKLARGLLKRAWENTSDVKTVANALRMLGDVIDQFIMSITASTHSMLSEGLQNQVLDKLAFANTALFLSIENGRLCTEGTRAEFLADLFAWAMAANEPTICWVSGAAGSGKTTIAYTLCSFLRGLGLLGGSFFCARDADHQRRSTKFIFSTLARSLAHQDGAYARLLADALKEPGAGSFIASEQLTNLIVAPIRLAHSRGSLVSAPIRILVIDALDECGNDPTTVYNIIRKLLTETRGLRIKFLITSRPEPHILQAFENGDQGSYLARRLQDIPDDAAETDIKTYLETELREFALSRRLHGGWPSEAQIQALSAQAGALFIYASTARNYICQFADDPVVRLDNLIAVRAEPWRGIDPMYKFVLDQARRSKTDRTWITTRHCLQAIVCLSHPLCLGDLGDLLEVDHQEVRMALSGLQSVLNITSSDDSDSITAFHTSFLDYLLDATRSWDEHWSLQSGVVHRTLLQRCITIMTSNLCFNISNSNTSYASNDEQPVKPVINKALRYSCLHWIDHLKGCTELTTPQLAELSELLMERFLYWLEVLSVTGEVQRAPIIMTKLLKWLHATYPHTDDSDELRRTNDPVTRQDALHQNLGRFARDARDFVNRFMRPIEGSCPHIYLSALAATSRNSSVWTKLSPRFKRLPNIITRQIQHAHSIFVLHGCRSRVTSVAFSPDGTRMISGSWDGAVRLWDTATGGAVGDPMRGHECPITSVAFLPDGVRIVSGSSDRTIRLWDAATGAAVGGPLRGHENRISSIAFSADGTRIVSGSNDRTIRLWNPATGAAIGDPIRGHERGINSVAFSPDGTRIVSGSDDRTIRLWDAATGAAIGEPLPGHASWVESVAFSPDGTRIVSGSDDRTIRLWNAVTRVSFGDPFRGHEGSINSVAFSPDGTYIVSGSDDATIRLWNAATGAAVGGPLCGHGFGIYSVAFSPDGTHVVSGSDDNTIRMWDAAAGTIIGDTLGSHKGRIGCVAFSPDGSRIVSGSDDRTIRLWDAATGAAVGDSLRGHEDGIYSIAFSPDGTRVVSGSSDCTVRLWNAATGSAIGSPFRGHAYGINSVAFSLDGTRVVSGSWDRTIRLWDAATGATLGGPLSGHEDGVSSVAFSPDGTHVVSGSFDCTIRLWDAATGAAIGDPFRGHEDGINSVAFSSDGTRLISGSWDATIQLWDAFTGAALGDQSCVHEFDIDSVALSPERIRVVARCSDRTIRVLDTAVGGAFSEPLRCHEGYINCLAFSPDGTRVVSGSSDGTIRLWDATMGAGIDDSRRGHEDGISSVTGSPNGMHAVSTSLHGTIRGWDKLGASVDSAMQNQNMNHSCFNGADHHRDTRVPSAAGLDHVARPVLTLDRPYRAAFSPNDAHAAKIPIPLPLRSGQDPRDAFALDEAGWLWGPSGERLLWILPEYRRGLWWPRSITIMGTHPVMLDLSNFVHGKDWTKCYYDAVTGI